MRQKKIKILILYLGYNDMVKKPSHATVPLKTVEWTNFLYDYSIKASQQVNNFKWKYVFIFPGWYKYSTLKKPSGKHGAHTVYVNTSTVLGSIPASCEKKFPYPKMDHNLDCSFLWHK